MLYREDRDVNCYHTVDDEVQNEEQHKSQLSTYTKYINSIEESHLLKFKHTCVLINLRIHFFNHNKIKILNIHTLSQPLLTQPPHPLIRGKTKSNPTF